MNEQQLQQIIEQYKANPNQFSAEQRKQIEDYASANNIPLANPNESTDIMRLLGNFVFNAADSMALGVLPDDIVEAPRTGAERAAAFLGELGGAMMPWGAGAKLGSMGAKFLAPKIAEGGKIFDLLSKMGIDSGKVSGAIQGAIEGGAMDLFESGINPAGILLGGAAGGMFNKAVGEEVSETVTKSKAAKDFYRKFASGDKENTLEKTIQSISKETKMHEADVVKTLKNSVISGTEEKMPQSMQNILRTNPNLKNEIITESYKPSKSYEELLGTDANNKVNADIEAGKNSYFFGKKSSAPSYYKRLVARIVEVNPDVAPSVVAKEVRSALFNRNKDALVALAKGDRIADAIANNLYKYTKTSEKVTTSFLEKEMQKVKKFGVKSEDNLYESVEKEDRIKLNELASEISKKDIDKYSQVDELVTNLKNKNIHLRKEKYTIDNKEIKPEAGAGSHYTHKEFEIRLKNNALKEDIIGEMKNSNQKVSYDEIDKAIKSVKDKLTYTDLELDKETILQKIGKKTIPNTEKDVSQIENVLDKGMPSEQEMGDIEALFDKSKKIDKLTLTQFSK